MMKNLIKKISYFIIYSALTFTICYYVMNLAGNLQEKSIMKNPNPIDYKVIDVLSYKKIENNEIIVYLVIINNHEYTMKVESLHHNVQFRHYQDCRRCFNEGISYPNDMFSIFDGLTIELKNKIENMKK